MSMTLESGDGPLQPMHEPSSALSDFASSFWHGQEKMWSDVLHGQGTIGDDGMALAEAAEGVTIGNAALAATGAVSLEAAAAVAVVGVTAGLVGLGIAVADTAHNDS